MLKTREEQRYIGIMQPLVASSVSYLDQLLFHVVLLSAAPRVQFAFSLMYITVV